MADAATNPSPLDEAISRTQDNRVGLAHNSPPPDHLSDPAENIDKADDTEPDSSGGTGNQDSDQLEPESSPKISKKSFIWRLGGGRSGPLVSVLHPFLL